MRAANACLAAVGQCTFEAEAVGAPLAPEARQFRAAEEVGGKVSWG